MLNRRPRRCSQAGALGAPNRRERLDPHRPSRPTLESARHFQSDPFLRPSSALCRLEIGVAGDFNLAQGSGISLDPTDTLFDTLWRVEVRTPADEIPMWPPNSEYAAALNVRHRTRRGRT